MRRIRDFRWIFSRDFTLVWAGQFVSIVGSGITGFGLSVWVYQETGSATQFAVVMVLATLPMVLLWPAAGVAADRWGRREAMMLSDAGAGLSSLSVLLLLVFGVLEVWHVYLAAAVHSSFGAFQWPAYSAAVPDLVAKKHLGRANGLVELGIAGGRVLGPLFGGALLATTGLGAILAIDVVTFLAALVTLLLVRIPRPAIADGEAPADRMREAFRGWTYIRARPALVALIVFFVLTNFTSAVPQVLLTPLVLSFGTEVELGAVMSILGIGMVIGGLIMTISGGPRRLVVGMLGAVALQGAAFVGYGLIESVAWVAAAGFVYGVCLTIIRGTHQTLWQRKVPADVLGRVSAFRSAVVGLPYPAAFFTAGVLADLLFEPAMAADGVLADSIGYVLGTGPGRGTALLVVLAGVLTIVFCAAAYADRRIRHLENELPEAGEKMPDRAGVRQPPSLNGPVSK